MKKITKAKYILLLFLTTLGTSLKAHQKARFTDSLTTINNLSAQLSVNKQKAEQIQLAFNYNRKAIVQILKDTTIKVPEKQQRLRMLMAERQRRINAVLTPAQSALLKQRMAMLPAMQAVAAVKLNHEAEMTRTAHTRLFKSGNAGIIKNKQ